MKAAGNSDPWVERDNRPAAWGIGHWALVISLPHSPCPKTPSPGGWSFSFLNRREHREHRVKSKEFYRQRLIYC